MNSWTSSTPSPRTCSRSTTSSLGGRAPFTLTRSAAVWPRCSTATTSRFVGNLSGALVVLYLLLPRQELWPCSTVEVETILKNANMQGHAQAAILAKESAEVERAAAAMAAAAEKAQALPRPDFSKMQLYQPPGGTYALPLVMQCDCHSSFAQRGRGVAPVSSAHAAGRLPGTGVGLPAWPPPQVILALVVLYARPYSPWKTPLVV